MHDVIIEPHFDLARAHACIVVSAADMLVKQSIFVYIAAGERASPVFGNCRIKSTVVRKYRLSYWYLPARSSTCMVRIEGCGLSFEIPRSEIASKQALEQILRTNLPHNGQRHRFVVCTENSRRPLAVGDLPAKGFDVQVHLVDNFVSGDGAFSLNELLWHPLPQADVFASPNIHPECEEDQFTQPTTVHHWSSFEREVKTRLALIDIMAMQTRRYAGVGIMSQDFQLGKDGVISSLVSSACGRLNHIFKKQGMKMRFGIHPGKHTSYMQVMPSVEVHAGKDNTNVPDIVMLELDGNICHSRFTIAVRTRFHLQGVHLVNVAELWTMYKDGHHSTTVPDSAAHNACQAIAHEVGHMSRRGHLYGMISTYHHSWFLKADGRGALWISDAIAAVPPDFDFEGGVSVVEAMLFAALSSVEGAVSPYPTARQLGGQPVPVASKPSLSSDILETSAPTAAITNAATGGAVLLSPRRPLQHIPVLSLQLAKYVWYGKCEGTAVAVRVALSVDDINNAQTEVAVYHHLQQLQGEHMPQLLDYGWSGQAFCVVMTFVQGKPFDWHSTEHRSLDDQLLAVIDKVHRFGVCHHDLHSGNILITAEDEVVLLDFAAAKLNSSAEVCCEEREHMAMLLSLKAACHA